MRTNEVILRQTSSGGSNKEFHHGLPDTVDWSEMSLEGVEFSDGAVVVLVHLEVFPARNEHGLVWMQRGRVQRGRQRYGLHLG